MYIIYMSLHHRQMMQHFLEEGTKLLSPLSPHSLTQRNKYGSDLHQLHQWGGLQQVT
jgi:hypothetical protein